MKPFEELAPILRTEIDLHLHVRDAEVAAEILRRADGEERERFSLAALRVGVLAIKQAGGVIDEGAIRDAGKSLLADLAGALEGHRTRVTGDVAASLKQYFDRQSGAFPAQVEGLVGPGGRLQALLNDQLSGDRSALARTLVAHVGLESPLLRMLSPEQKDGLLARLTGQVEAALEAQRVKLLAEFDLNRPEGALARLVTQMQGGQRDLKKVFDDTVGSLAREFSLDRDDSSLSRFKREIGKQVGDLVEGQTKFQREVMKELEGLRTRREADEGTTRKGVAFEAALCQLLSREAEKGRDLGRETGAVVGALKNCKKGDYVIELGSECAAAGEQIVIEAKDVTGYALKDALAEIAEARANRKAQVGVFVYARAAAPAGTGPFRRVGDDLIVTWDVDDPSTDIYVTAAIEVARALVVRRVRALGDATASFEMVDQIVNQLEKYAEVLESISTSGETVKNAGLKIVDESRLLRKRVAEALSGIRSHVTALRPTPN